MDFFGSFSLLAEANNAPPQQPAPGLETMLLPMALIIGVWYLLILRPQGKERRHREQLLNNLKKNDRVVTYSGIIGTVASFSNDGKEVTLRVDDNVKLKFLRSAIQSPLAEASEEAARSAT